MNIQTVKLQGDRYLVNGVMNVPNDVRNGDYKKVLQWISDGNTPAPEFTAEEITANTDAKVVANCVKALDLSDKKVLIDASDVQLWVTYRDKIRQVLDGSWAGDDYPVPPFVASKFPSGSIY